MYLQRSQCEPSILFCFVFKLLKEGNFFSTIHFWVSWLFCFVLFCFVFCFVFQDRVSLYSPAGCPGTYFVDQAGHLGTHFIDQAGLELRNLPAYACFCLPSAGIKGMCHHYPAALVILLDILNVPFLSFIYLEF